MCTIHVSTDSALLKKLILNVFCHQIVCIFSVTKLFCIATLKSVAINGSPHLHGFGVGFNGCPHLNGHGDGFNGCPHLHGLGDWWVITTLYAELRGEGGLGPGHLQHLPWKGHSIAGLLLVLLPDGHGSITQLVHYQAGTGALPIPGRKANL